MTPPMVHVHCTVCRRTPDVRGFGFDYAGEEDCFVHD